MRLSARAPVRGLAGSWGARAIARNLPMFCAMMAAVGYHVRGRLFRDRIDSRNDGDSGACAGHRRELLHRVTGLRDGQLRSRIVELGNHLRHDQRRRAELRLRVGNSGCKQRGRQGSHPSSTSQHREISIRLPRRRFRDRSRQCRSRTQTPQRLRCHSAGQLRHRSGAQMPHALRCAAGPQCWRSGSENAASAPRPIASAASAVTRADRMGRMFAKIEL